MRFIKITIISLLLIISLISITFLGFIFSMDPNDYKLRLGKNISEQVGRPVTLKGDIHWSVFPQIGLQTEDVIVENRPGFTNDPILRADMVQLQLKLLPLLKKNIVVKEIHIRNAILNLQVNSQGKNNWSDVTKQEVSTKKASRSYFAKLDVKRVKLDDIHINYDDLQQGHHYDVDHAQYDGRFTLDIDHRPAFARLNLNGNLQMPVVHFDKTQLTDLSTSITANDGVIHLNELQLRWYEGDVLATATIDTTKAKTSVLVKASIENSQLEPMFTDLKYIDKITGVLAGTINLSSSDISQLASTLNGTLQFQIANGVIHGVSLKHSVQLLSKLILHKSFYRSSDNNTAFKAVTGDITLVDGVAESHNIELDSENLTTTGSMQANLAAKTFNMNLAVKLNHSLADDQLIKVQSCFGGVFPVVIHGTFAHYQTDMPTTAMLSRCTASGAINSIGSLTNSAKNGATYVWNKLHGLWQ